MAGLYRLELEGLTRMLAQCAANADGLDEGHVLLKWPDPEAPFPCCVLAAPLAKPLYLGQAYELTLTAEVWAEDPLQAAGLFCRVNEQLARLNVRMSGGAAPAYDKDIAKWRYSGTFAVRWNAINNTLEQIC